MSEKKSTGLKLEDFIKQVNELRGKLETSGFKFTQNVNDLMNQLLALELQEVIEAKLEEMKNKYKAKTFSHNEPGLVLPILNDKVIEALKNADLDTLIKLKLLTSPTPISGDSLLLLTLIPLLTGGGKGSNGSSNVNLESLLKVVEKAYERTPYQDLINLYKEILQNHPTIQQLQHEINELKQRIEMSDPVKFVQTVKALSQELGLSSGKSPVEVELEKMKLDLEKWKLEQEMRLKEIELMEKLKRRDKLETMKMREQIFKYLLAPLIKTFMPKVMKLLPKGKGPELEQLMKLPIKEINCPKCGNKFIIKAMPDGKFPDEVICPYCGLKLVKKSKVVTPSEKSKEEKPIEQVSKEGETGESKGKGFTEGGIIGLEERKEE